MRYLERRVDERLAPARLLAGARSLVVLAASYAGPGDALRGSIPSSAHAPLQSPPDPGNSPPFAPSPAPLPGPARGRVARYARYRDYHDVLRERLDRLARWIEHAGGPGTRSRVFVDTGPLLERALAQQAGLGFIGKHTNLVGRRTGNWCFLAEILTTLELPPDRPEPNRCGSCTRCLAACPTGAIVAPFVIDARRCLSYLTIEFRGTIPEDLRPALGRRVFGCDDCLEACPWNRFAVTGRLMQTCARPDLAEPDLAGLLALDDAAFRQRFAGTPLLRGKRRGLLRNVCVALGNTAGPEAAPALERASADPEPLIAEHARWALDRIQRRSALTLASEPGACPGTRAHLPTSPLPECRALVVRASGSRPTPSP